MDAIYIQSTPINIFNDVIDPQYTIKFDKFGPGLRISLFGRKTNDVNIYDSTLDSHEEECSLNTKITNQNLPLLPS